MRRLRGLRLRLRLRAERLPRLRLTAVGLLTLRPGLLPRLLGTRIAVTTGRLGAVGLRLGRLGGRDETGLEGGD